MNKKLQDKTVLVFDDAYCYMKAECCSLFGDGNLKKHISSEAWRSSGAHRLGHSW